MGKTLKDVAKRAGTKVKAAMGSEKDKTLSMWQDRLERSRRALQPDLEVMDWREELYAGTRTIQRGANSRSTGAVKKASTVYNFVSELIEAQIDSNVPYPKVSPINPEDENLAQEIERMLMCERDRLPVEYLNDEQERTCPVQGGSWVAAEWDNTIRTHTTVGDTTLTLLHPKQVLVQPGVHDHQKASWIICQYAVTKDYVKSRYNVDVEDETEERPEVNYAYVGTQGTSDTDNVTLNMAFFRNKQSFVGMYAWVNETPVAEFEDFLARRMEVCSKCGRERSGDECECGSKKFETSVRENETITEDITLLDGTLVAAGTEVPYYRPRVLPLVLRKNISVFGKLLGESDVDKIADQQERSKKLETKVDEKALKGGSILTLPRDLQFEKNDNEMRIVRVRGASDVESIKSYTLQPNFSYDVSEIERSRQSAKNILGITDSFQGMPDRTATSGIARQVAASQSAGRLESKRRMKAAAWADIYQLLFLLKLAFADEPRSYMVKNYAGAKQFGKFDRYHFLKKDANGELYYEDQFLFSVDDSSGLANNRQAMWQENRANYQNGAFGNVGTPESRVGFWRLQEKYHYPGAVEQRMTAEEQYAQEMAVRQQEAAAQMEMAKAQMQQQAMQAQAGQPPTRGKLPEQRTGAATNAAPVAQQARTPTGM